ncbi:lipase [Actinoplanes sp. Pm04-4]|uniref:Lipase n=1 Tax=Paractinoplanes pyxinae TaxID=2997416 RepID=A0ABT4ARR6_9ACTN|nr:SGNH/GDSL hydrolase family protein [Actinoplanes pyxinae]MCY1136943.1 lipase [Actinoplanes pyxinae]
MITTPVTVDLIRGAVELEQTAQGLLPHRLPAWARAQGNDPQLTTVEAQPSGVRVVFRTKSTVIDLVTAPTKLVQLGAPPQPEGVYDLYADGVLAGQQSVTGGTTVTIDLATGAVEAAPGEPGLAHFSGLSPTLKTVEIWLPHREKTELVELRTDEPVEPAPASGRPRWLHHGSSISHGSNAASPSTTWPAVAAARGGYELTNLGFGGSALLDPFTARTMRDLPADLISFKMGINVVNADLMRVRAFGPAVHGFLDTLREGHPSTPLVVVSPIYCPIHEDTPGPGAFDMAALAEGRLSFIATGDPAERAAGKLTLNVIRDELARIVAERAKSDPQLSYLDGRELYGEADFAVRPLPDQLHPDAASHLSMGERFADRVFR